MKGAKARELRQAASQIAGTYAGDQPPDVVWAFKKQAYKRMKKLFMDAKKRGQN